MMIWWKCDSCEDMKQCVVDRNAINDVTMMMIIDVSDGMIRLVAKDCLSTHGMIVLDYFVIRRWSILMIFSWSLTIEMMRWRYDSGDDMNKCVVDWNVINDVTMMMIIDVSDGMIRLVSKECLSVHGMIVLHYFEIWRWTMVMLWTWSLTMEMMMQWRCDSGDDMTWFVVD